MRKFYYYISSMKTGLGLLGLIILVSAAGSSLRPDTFFHSSLFKILLLFLFINMVLCTVNRVFLYTKIYPKIREKNKVYLLYHLGILLLHAGIVIILIGGAINAYGGKSILVPITEGEKIEVSNLVQAKKTFAIRLDKFEIVYYPDGSPSQYNSYISILENDKEINRYQISVNHPLKYAGIKAYQQSFGHLIKAEIINTKGKSRTESLKEGDFILVPETDRRIKAYRYVPNFDPRYGINTKTLRPDNPRIIYSVYEKDKMLGVGVASFGEKVQVSKNYYVVFKEVQPFTVLKIKSDPGLPFAMMGALLLILGIIVVFLCNPVIKK